MAFCGSKRCSIQLLSQFTSPIAEAFSTENAINITRQRKNRTKLLAGIRLGHHEE
ncbi:hypothetical protein HMPREF0673_00689 [Leyella stercorea DSM 18206]|uniref:Uncharacterized protein n=1 Tax=Leyella stercorea DSM 18206 TaxID=1002367 RepID=G6AVQ2_9BACT|nr:hypothetical protein HMPREF0673_00689 [Leyella stercorea DSM 18206]